jgi:hypothetical protein
MPSQQRTSTAVPIVVQADPPLDGDTPLGGSDISTLLTSGTSAGKLEISVVSDASETLTNVRVSLREDDKFEVVAQGGIGDVFFAALDVVAGRSVKFVVSDVGRPTHAVVSAGFEGTLSATCKRLES